MRSSMNTWDCRPDLLRVLRTQLWLLNYGKDEVVAVKTVRYITYTDLLDLVISCPIWYLKHTNTGLFA